MMHHLAQRTSASWVPAAFRQPGLGVFVPIGYLLVSFFFFCSGYGLIKRLRTDDDYMHGFLIRRLNRLLMVFVLTEIIFLLVRFAFESTDLPLNPYSWFVYTIFFLYIGFYFSYRKNSHISLLLMILWIFGYCVICHILVKGNWWINTAPVFAVGIYMADHEENTLFRRSGNRILRFVLLAAIFLSCFFLSENANAIGHLLNISAYGIIYLFQILLQTIAGSAFSLLVFWIASSLKEESDNKVMYILEKVLSFYGGMTLEFYLIHGLFVMLFSHHFIYDSNPPVCYIRNVPLYVLTVFLLSTAAAFLLRKICDLISAGYQASEIFQKFCKDAKKFAFIFLLILTGITIAYSVHRHRLSADASRKLTEYRDEYITYETVAGEEIAVYLTGEGPYTLVFLGAEFDTCPTLSLRVLTDKLSDRYRCMIIDYPGKGFSPDTDRERSADYFADLIHDTLQAADAGQNIILIPHQISAFYAYRYIEKYPEEVTGLIGISALVPELATRFLDGNFSSVDEYRWYLKRITRLDGFIQKCLNFTGYTALFQMPALEYLFYGSGLKEYYPVMEEMFFRHYQQAAHLDEQRNFYDNCMAVKDFKLPDYLPALFMLDYATKESEPYGIKWEDEYNKMIAGHELQKVEIISGDPYAVYYRAGYIADRIDKFLMDIDDCSDTDHVVQ
ncbi:MAG: acyltransferase family protein [Lachnospiraceae bacterium]|nr:acyltransferase family protein [Lachnospiraceae bacterium]